MSDDPVARLAELFREYAPLVDALLASTPETVTALVRKETNLGRRIIVAAGYAFGDVASARLEILEPKPDECAEILDWLISEKWFTVKHRHAALCCLVRSKRLRQIFEEAEIGRPKGKGGRKPKDPPEEIAKGRQLVRHGWSGRAAAREMGKRRGLTGKDLERYVNRNHKKMSG